MVFLPLRSRAARKPVKDFKSTIKLTELNFRLRNVGRRSFLQFAALLNLQITTFPPKRKPPGIVRILATHGLPFIL